MTYEYDDDAGREAANHALGPVRVDEIARRCHELLEQLGPDAVAGHSISYSKDAWIGLLDVLPPAAREGRVTRGDVFEVAKAVSSGQQPVRDLFTASYIWGQGGTGYGRSRYDKIIAVGAKLDACLDRALQTARVDVVDAYAQLFGGYVRDGGEPRAASGDDRWSRVAGYGPAFFTKFLYFAGGRALILDNVLAGSVHELSEMKHLVDSHGRARAWSPYRYDVYLHWMEQTAATVSSVEPAIAVAADLLELALFKTSTTVTDEFDAAD